MFYFCVPTRGYFLVYFIYMFALLRKAWSKNAMFSKVFFGVLGFSALLALGFLFASPLYVVSAAIAVAILVGVFVKPEIAIVVFAAYTPFEPFLLKFVPDDVYVFARYFSEMLIYVLLLAIAVRVIMKRVQLRSTPIDWPFAGLVITALVSIVMNMVPAVSGVLGLRQIIRFMLLFFAAVYLNPSTEFIRRLTIMMGVIVLGEAGLGLAQAVSGGALDALLLPSQARSFGGIQLTQGTEQFWAPGTRVFGTLGRYDQLGTFLCLFMLLAVGLLYFVKQQRERWVLWAVLAVGIPALALTFSRASWFGFVLGVMFIAGYFMKDWRVRVGVVACAVLAVGYVATTGLVVRNLVESREQTIVERFFESFSLARYRGEYYGIGRVFWIANTPKVVAESPVFGVGPSMYGGGAAAALHNTEVYDRLKLPFGVYGTDGYIDNNWLSIWGEVGTLGLLCYLGMMVMLWIMSVRIFRNAKDPYVRGLALGYVGVILAISLQAFLATSFEIRTLASYFWLYGGLIYVLGRRENVFPHKK